MLATRPVAARLRVVVERPIDRARRRSSGSAARGCGSIGRGQLLQWVGLRLRGRRTWCGGLLLCDRRGAQYKKAGQKSRESLYRDAESCRCRGGAVARLCLNISHKATSSTSDRVECTALLAVHVKCSRGGHRQVQASPASRSRQASVRFPSGSWARAAGDGLRVGYQDRQSIVQTKTGQQMLTR